MVKYEKKMMQFEAFQYTGDLSIPVCDKDYDETKHFPEWAALAVLKGILFYDVSNPPERPELYTRHPDGEVVHIPVGYYIIRWSDTELYPCEPNLFEASYKPALCEIKEKCVQIANEYGYDPQSRQIIEEMAELTVAINKHWRTANKFLGNQDSDMQQEVYKAIDRITEELADVQIMAWQMQYLLGVKDDDFEKRIEDKILRKLERIKKRHAESDGDVK